MMKLKEVRWGFIGCGEVTEKKSGPAFNMIEGSNVITYRTGILMPKSLSAMKT